ncbi:hypothetical protein [Tenuifilum osseticum]|uniref:hypothetical protein n=1 Tax=Tenuifilum TaxID=2760873 RepID=UPI00309982FC
MKKIVLISLLMALVLTSCYEGNHTFSVIITGNQETYKVSYRDNKGVWRDTVTVRNGFGIYNEYSSDWQLDLIAIGDSVHVEVFSRYKSIKTFHGRDTLEIHEVIKYHN